jgi:hypothetical protein
VNGEPFRGFESHPLRHQILNSQISGFYDCVIVSQFSGSRTDNRGPMNTIYSCTIKSPGSRALVGILIATIIPVTFPGTVTVAQKRKPTVRHLSVCGDPTAPCTTTATFEPYDLPFRLPASAVIYDTELFYAVILKSIAARDDNCDVFIPENERLATQSLFADHKVFSTRCAMPGALSYSNTNPNQHFMAAYAGLTLVEANRMLAAAKATGKFPGANVRRMRATFNGT